MALPGNGRLAVGVAAATLLVAGLVVLAETPGRCYACPRGDEADDDDDDVAHFAEPIVCDDRVARDSVGGPLASASPHGDVRRAPRPALAGRRFACGTSRTRAWQGLGARGGLGRFRVFSREHGFA
ncbi:unnamed protein product [Lampetra planeri]